MLLQALQDKVGCRLVALGRVVFQIADHLTHDLAKVDRLMRTLRGDKLVKAVDHATNVDHAVTPRLMLRASAANGMESVPVPGPLRTSKNHEGQDGT
jgi:hypothetical protein